jgi:hypothetical protein
MHLKRLGAPPGREPDRLIRRGEGSCGVSAAVARTGQEREAHGFLFEPYVALAVDTQGALQGGDGVVPLAAYDVCDPEELLREGAREGSRRDLGDRHRLARVREDLLSSDIGQLPGWEFRTPRRSAAYRSCRVRT